MTVEQGPLSSLTEQFLACATCSRLMKMLHYSFILCLVRLFPEPSFECVFCPFRMYLNTCTCACSVPLLWHQRPVETSCRQVYGISKADLERHRKRERHRKVHKPRLTGELWWWWWWGGQKVLKRACTWTHRYILVTPRKNLSTVTAALCSAHHSETEQPYSTRTPDHHAPGSTPV